MVPLFEKIRESILDIVFPKNLNCISCNIPIDEENYLSMCKKCYTNLEYIKEICTKCGRSSSGSSICFECDKEKYYFDKIFSVLEYNNFIHGIIYRLKYGQEGHLSELFATLSRDFILENNIEFDFITGVPISKKREKFRGFNQSYLIAERIDKEKFVELFVRNKETKFLSELKRVERFLEVKNAFLIDEEVLDKMIEKFYKRDDCREIIKILIVDDIVTSGATLNEMSKLLKEKLYNVEIYVLGICNAKK